MYDLCRFVVLPHEINTKLRTKHINTTLECRGWLIEQAKAIKNLLKDQSKVQLSRIPINQISCLAAPRLDGLKYWKSGRVFRQVQKKRLHCVEEHLWKWPRDRGRPITSLELSAELPRINSFACQRLSLLRKEVDDCRYFKKPEKSEKGTRLRKPCHGGCGKHSWVRGLGFVRGVRWMSVVAHIKGQIPRKTLDFPYFFTYNFTLFPFVSDTIELIVLFSIL